MARPLSRLTIIILLSFLLTRPPLSALADGPAPEERFRWVEGVEGLNPREFPDRLSRGLPGHEGVAAPVPFSLLAMDFAHYPSSAEIATFIEELEGLYPDLVETYEVGASWQGRPVVGLRVGNEATGDPDDRPGLYLDGQHHAREPISQQVVLYSLWHLLVNYGSDPLVSHLLDTRTVYAVPSVNVDGNDIWLADDFSQRRTANPGSSDDDTDGVFDEDPANGMGYSTYQVYRFDLDQEWADSHPDDPFADGWEEHYLGSEYLGVFDDQGSEIPQLDDDDDGSANEDPVGGVDANRNYDVHWELGDDEPASTYYRGPTVWSEPETSAVRDFVLDHEHIITSLTFHSGADLILHPWAWAADTQLPDVFIYELLSRKGSQLTESNGFMGSPHGWAARALYSAPGTTTDWLYDHGIYAWTPEVYGASSIAFTERMNGSGSFRVGLSIGVGANPDPSDIVLTTERWNRFNLYVLAASPNVGLTNVSADGQLLTLTVANDGFIPVEVNITVTGDDDLSIQETIGYLQASERTVDIVYPHGARVQTLVVTLTAHSLAGTMSREVEVEQVEFRIEERRGLEKVTILRGHVADFVNLGRFFGDGGWLAPREFDTPGSYHLGPALLNEMFLPVICR